jgi:hypothetical protein
LIDIHFPKCFVCADREEVVSEHEADADIDKKVREANVDIEPPFFVIAGIHARWQTTGFAWCDRAAILVSECFGRRRFVSADVGPDR